MLGFAISVTFAAFTAGAPNAGVDYAFLVACGEYQGDFKPLPFAVKETREFRDALIASGYDPRNVKLIADDAERRQQPERKKILAELELLLARLQPEDGLLMLLNGHGVHKAGDDTGYFCPLDGELKDFATLIPMEGKVGLFGKLPAGDPVGGLFGELKRAKAKRKLLLVNACRNDPFSEANNQAADKREFDAFEPERVPEGVAMLSACKPGQFSFFFDPKRSKKPVPSRSLFVHHLIETWNSSADKLTIEELFSQVRRGVEADADEHFGQRQNPLARRDIRGDGEWVLRRKTPPPEPPSFPFSPSEAAAYQQRFAKALGNPVRLTLKNGMNLRLIPPGKFKMGSPVDEEGRDKDDEQQHDVRLTRVYYLGETEVTQAQFRALVKAYSSPRFKDEPNADLLPVENVSWVEAVAYCNALSEAEGLQAYYKIDGKTATIPDRLGKGYRLPTEAEWEWASRAGSAGPFSFIGAISPELINYEGSLTYGGSAKGLNRAKPVAVGSLPANPFGLHEVHGNVWEWCFDAYGKDFYGYSPSDNPANVDGAFRLFRGGGWRYHPVGCRVASRGRGEPHNSSSDLGFRIARVP